MNFDMILLDIETQRDFFVPGGACYRPQADTIRERIYALCDWAKTNDQPIVSTLLRLPAGQIGPLADVPHCIEGSDGERKLSKTLISPYVNFGHRNVTDLPPDLFEQYRQAIFEKRDTDLFAHPRAERLMTELPRLTFVLCGAGIAGGIVEAAVGLRTRGFSVVLANDAVLPLNDPREEMAWKRMEAKGVVFTRTAEIIQPTPRKKPARFRRSQTVRQ